MKTKKGIKQNKPRRLSYEELLNKYNPLSYLMDQIPDVIYFKDKKGRLVLVNQAHAKGLGLKPEQVEGKTDFDFFPRRRAQEMLKDDTYVIRTGKPIIDKIERATRPDGVDNYVSTTKIPWFDEKKRVIGVIGITRDITRRKQFERLKEEKMRIEKRLEVAEELNKIKSEFISVVSHELRTPLAIIEQLVMLVYDQTAGPVNDKQKEALKRTRDNIDRLKSLVDELLDISRIENERFKLHSSLVNLNDLIKDSSAFFKKLAQDKEVSLSYYLPEKQINLFIDAERVNQILSNLIDNAVKFTEQGGRIKIEVKTLENKVRIGVLDTGIGIAKSDTPRLFNKFEQVSKIAGAERKGMGLGLFIVKELVEKHGGQVWAESKSGAGSKFYFTLPRFYPADLWDLLDSQIKERINTLLGKGAAVHFINLQLVNYIELKKRVGVRPAKLLRDLEAIIEETLKKVYAPGEEKRQAVLKDSRNGKFGVVLSGITEKKVLRFSELFKEKIRGYFTKNKLENVFITLGFLSSFSRDQAHPVKHLPANAYIKEISIGLEVRHFPRAAYNVTIKTFLPENKIESSQTIDVSLGGVCFVTKRLLKTDSQMRLSLELPKNKTTICVRARVAWIQKMQPLPGQAGDRYKVGLEFIGLKNKDRKILSKELKSLLR